VPTRLPLFPLGSVLVPGQVLPLHVFEPRYRVLVEDLLALPEAQRRFGVVAIRSGREVGDDGVLALHEVGCAAQVRRVEPFADGRFAVVSTGATRFRLLDVEHDKPYLTGVVEELAERAGDGAAVLADSVATSLADYARALSAAGDVEPAELAGTRADPRTLSYLLAVAMRIDLEDRQALLEVTDDASRLRAGLALLRRESRLMRLLSAVPAPELARVPLSPN
jgi:uncharacterized protein